MKKKLLFVAPILSRSGYGDHAREVAQFLITQKKSFDIKIAGTPWGNNPQTGLADNADLEKELSEFFITENDKYDGCDVYIQLGLPSEFKTIGKFNIGITAGVETDKVGKTFIDGINRMDLVVVPSNFTKETFENSSYEVNSTESVKTTTPIKVVGEYADECFYTEDNIPTEIKELSDIEEDFCFLFVGQSSSDDSENCRKNIKSLINSFISAFDKAGNKPALILKTSGSNVSVSDYFATTKNIKKIKEEHPSKTQPNIYLLHGDFNSSELSAIYKNTKVKAFVTHTRGEGFGRPILEASLCGLPILATKWSGHLDITDKKNSVLLPGTLKPVGISNELFCENSNWMEVDNQYSSDCMKKVYSEYDKYKQKAEKLKSINVSKFNKQTANEQYSNILSEILNNNT